MDFKKIRKNISYFLGWTGLTVCSLIIRITPGRWIYGLAKNIAFLGYFIASKQRNTALESLSIAFGAGKTAEEIEQVAKNCFIAMAKSGVELIYLMDKPALLKERVKFVGKEHLDQALSRGKGIILVSAHFGNFPLMLAKLSLEGYKPAGIMRYMKDERTEKLFAGKRSRLGIKTIYSQPRKACVDESIRHLRDNGVLFIPIDQNFGTAGVFVDFFGRKAATATGPIVMAQRTGAVILPCFIVRQSNDTHNIILEKPLEMEEGRTDEETITLNIQKLTKIIEFYIRIYPQEWGWIHRRWKAQMKTI